MQAASVFVLYATSSANQAAQKSSRKTITGGDVISAMGDMDFDKVERMVKMLRFVALLYFHFLQFVRPLENSLAIWKKSQKDKKDSAAAKKKASGDTKSKESEENSEETENTAKDDTPADDETEESKNDEDKENK